MDEQSGESEEEEVMGEGIGKSEMNRHQNKVDEEIKGVDSRETIKLKHNERSDPWFLKRMMKVAGRMFFVLGSDGQISSPDLRSN